MRLKKPVIAVSTVALLALAACGGSDSSAPETGSDTSAAGNGGNAGAGMDPSRQAPAPPIEGAEEGGIVKVISIAGLNTMDPTEAYYTNTISIMSHLVARSLTQYAYDPATGDSVLVPDLATDLGTPNKDFTEWTFTIREGVRYENGDEVTPEDIKFGIERSFDRTTFPDGASWSNEYFQDGDTYKGPYTGGGDYSGVTIDGQDLTIAMDHPFPDMPQWGAFPAMGPIPAGDASDPSKYALHPLATGPYMFGDYTPEQSLTLVRNPEWDPNTDPARHQYPDSYDMEFDVDTAKIDQIMLQDEGEGQTTLTYDDISVDKYLPMKQDSPDRLVVGSQPCTFYWAPDYRKIDDIKIRQALAFAYPYADVSAARGFIDGITYVPGTGLMPPGIPGREEYNPLPEHEAGTTDTDAAMKLLEEADAVGYEIKFLYGADDPSRVDAKNAVVASLEKAGFTATPVASTIANLSSDSSDPDADINVRSYGWCSDWPSGLSWVPPLLGTTNLDEEGLGFNASVFSEPAIDKKMAAVIKLPLEDQPAAWNALDQEINTKYFPLFVTNYGGVAMAHGSKIMGMEADRTSGMPTWNDMWVSP